MSGPQNDDARTPQGPDASAAADAKLSAWERLRRLRGGHEQPAAEPEEDQVEEQVEAPMVDPEDGEVSEPIPDRASGPVLPAEAADDAGNDGDAGDDEPDASPETAPDSEPQAAESAESAEALDENEPATETEALAEGARAAGPEAGAGPDETASDEAASDPVTTEHAAPHELPVLDGPIGSPTGDAPVDAAPVEQEQAREQEPEATPEPAPGDDASTEPDTEAPLAPVPPAFAGAAETQDAAAQDLAEHDSAEEDSAEPDAAELDAEGPAPEQYPGDGTAPETTPETSAAAPLSPVPHGSALGTSADGAAATATAVTTEAQAKDTAEADRAKRSRPIALIAVVAAVVIAAVIAFMFWPREAEPEGPAAGPTSTQEDGSGTSSPSSVVEQFGRLLAAGDADAAVKMLDITSVTATGSTGHPLLNKEIYAAAKNRPSAIVVDPASTAVPSAGARTAMVTASTKQDGRDVKLSLNLTRENNTAPWKITLSSLPSFTIEDAGGATIKVNDKKVKLGGSADDFTPQKMFVLPGSYTVERKNDKYVDYPKAKTMTASAAALSTGSNGELRRLGTLSLKGKNNEAFKTEATKVVNKWLEGCAAATEMAPKNCPFSASKTYQGAPLTDVSWTITQQPTITFPEHTTGDPTVEGSGGAAKVTGQAMVNNAETTVNGTVPTFGFHGELTVKDDKISFKYAR